MLEATLLCVAASLLGAATTHRFRPQAGAPGLRMRIALRCCAIVLLLAALLCCGTQIPGERVVRLLGAASIAAAIAAIVLSAAPALALRPVRLLIGFTGR